ncbi:DNA repair protein RAD16 [Malassezia psittaci]|uniref:DNA repair protein RAD16 n=1 Tax=Malassezia psittaci TaxID=1821823 RepID=A0AAF0F8R8_9BASI|nr:DNA repair protein RAD16 [Malassezia psittaci]
MSLPASRQWLLPYHRAILSKLVPDQEDEEERDRLVVLAPGLGLRRVVATLLRAYYSPENLVVVVNASPRDVTAMNRDLMTLGLRHNTIKILHHEMPSRQRAEAYMDGGIMSVTSRILIVDMLSKRIPTAKITGIVVLHAERVTAKSIEAFILRIYREQNQDGFLKAFSSNAESLSTGSTTLQSIMGQLRLRNLDIWPRFHQSIDRDLGQHRADVIELHQPSTPAMRSIQSAIVECLEGTLAEVRRSKLADEVDDFSVENAMHRAFDVQVRRQLEPVWHRIAPSTKQLVSDLGILRTLLHYLYSYESVSFYTYLQTILAANASESSRPKQSAWLMTDASNVIFSEARRRLWHETSEGKTELVLEEPPKWQLLLDVMDEIEQQVYQEPSPILIMTETERSATQLRAFLSSADDDPEHPGRPVMAANFSEYLQWKQSMDARGSQGPTSVSEEVMSEAMQRKSARNSAQKRRRIRGGMAMPVHTHADQAGSVPTLPGEHLQTTTMETKPEAVDDTLEDYFGLIDLGQAVVIHTYGGDEDDSLLQELRPRFVVMYDPNPQFVRQVELYRALHRAQVQVYFFMYTDSVEEQMYLAQLRREKDSFERLIKQKANMAIPLTAEGQPEEDADQRMLRRLSSRVGGGGNRDQLRLPPSIVVDMREFRSSLPSLLHAAGMQVTPCTLQVGDYVIASDMCVERKSLTDLVQSLNSGRLYTQCEAMSVHYQHPILLIEFEQERAFTLESIADNKPTRTNPTELDVQSKLVLLTLSFPRLRIIWSSSPYATAEIFAELKQSHDEPDAATAANIGMDDDVVGDNTINLTPVDMLRAMPGVTAKNYIYLMNAIENVSELCAASSTTLEQIIGREPGRKLHSFLHTNSG